MFYRVHFISQQHSILIQEDLVCFLVVYWDGWMDAAAGGTTAQSVFINT